MKTKTEIINETVEFYSKDPVNNRAFSQKGGYEYINKDNKKCAVGRCIKDSILEEERNTINAQGYVISLDKNYKGLDTILKDEYIGHDVDFWEKLQEIHDSNFNWTPEGLSENGKENVKWLLERYENQ